MRHGLSLFVCAIGVAAGAAASAAASPDWDQVQNIEEAARHIASLQRKEGAQKAINFVDACYRTHGLASAYSRPYEACIARDYMLAQTLAAVYSAIPPGERAKRGIPPPDSITKAMGRRIASAFAKYELTPDDAEAFRLLVEKHGFPIVSLILFGGKPVKPEAGDSQEKKGE